jgi:FMN phosphatase YigB (HAD superfamily)
VTPPGRVRAVCFDIGETLVSEDRAWGAIADEAGISRLTLFGVLGGLIVRGEHHARVFDILGIDRLHGPPYELSDLYPDAIPCLRALEDAGYAIGLAGNQPARTEEFLQTLGITVDLIASSAHWGVEKPSPAFFDRIATEFGRAPEEIAYVGDRVDNDIVPVNAAGMVSVHMLRGPWAYLQDGSVATIQLCTLADLPQALARV